MLDIVISLTLVAYMISNLLVQWQLRTSIDILADRVTALERIQEVLEDGNDSK